MQDELDDIIFVESPVKGDELAASGRFGVVESIEAVSDLYTSTSGAVTTVNEELFGAPELLNNDPYGDGWALTTEPADMSEFDGPLSPEEYREQME